MSLSISVKNLLKRNFPKLESFPSRYKVGKSDLLKGLSQCDPISPEQREMILAFWKPYLNSFWTRKAFDIRWFDIYNYTNLFGWDLRYYIPDSFYYCIIDTLFSDASRTRVLDDKNLYDLYFHDVLQPKTICRVNSGVFMDADYNVINEEKAISLCMENGKVIVKPSLNACAGAGIKKWDVSTSSCKEELRQILSSASSLIVQDFVQQHRMLSQFTNTCVNTLRLVTLFFGGEVHVCNAVIIMGGVNAVTNHLHSGGIVCGIMPSGRLMPVAFDGALNKYDKHPNGIVFSDCIIPNYSECLALVKRLAPRFAESSRLINWDLTIDVSGKPLLIETNLSFGGSVQIAGGPAFGDLTPEILDYVNRHSNF